MPGIEDLYQEIILTHYKAPKHRGTLADPTVSVTQNNPMCGDEIRVDVRLEDGRIADLAHSGQGCSISQSAASMMSEQMVGRTPGEALESIEAFRRVMHGDPAPDDVELGDAEALSGVARFPARVKCALLAWMALKDALQSVDDPKEATGGRSD
ncbi:MAG: SUF system NifU family Fe-S cluster assembly protein [Thermoleophilia bacterium]|nr:SUF system NifU family Fe-S cluster assembly protein [Thermoleophilia bacterium]